MRFRFYNLMKFEFPDGSNYLHEYPKIPTSGTKNLFYCVFNRW